MEVTVAQAGVELLFCNSFLQHHPTPLAGHRQEKTEKMRLEQEKTDGSAEPSPIAIFKNSAYQNGIFAICSLRMLLVH